MNDEEIEYRRFWKQIETLSEPLQRMEYLAQYLGSILETERAIFLKPEEIPDQGIVAFAWKNKEPLYVNDMEHDDRFIADMDRYMEEQYSILAYPIVDPISTSFEGVILFLGRAAHKKSEEELIPLKSGTQTIGVTVKQVQRDIPAYEFSSKHLETLDTLIPRLLEKVSGIPMEKNGKHTQDTAKREKLLKEGQKTKEPEEKQQHFALQSVIEQFKKIIGFKK